ncbi:hypothetical protein BKP35_18040 [Anaerobacillus arseniciselenatis]|uniref:Phosphofructokinase domain-containing protein n=1 Tax=Anaerobacillus arseniciselenatis TaxID=85682 RepID=A0A1S2L7F0_9BACI|nr:6-phosphofructokinase [Anaerobacillus arseniciselenatis]OIJ08230.1 hypothetical protein BKP35_18040 [Anaerobacillus arseniciselenatis]
MKIGVMNVGMNTGGVKDFLFYLGEKVGENANLVGVEYDSTAWNYTFKSLNLVQTVIKNKVSQHELKCTSFMKETAQLLQNGVTSEKLEALLVIGPIKETLLIYELLKDKTNVLCIPSSIYNDALDSDSTLGYDTALNSVINGVLQIKDTASSLVLDHIRVFGIQIPGNTTNSLLLDSAVAVNGIVVLNNESQEEVDKVKLEIEERAANGETYVFLFMNKQIDGSLLKRKLAFSDEIDFKIIEIDEAQCVGPYPTAADRVLAIKLVEKTLHWLEELEGSRVLVIQNREILAKQFIL